MAAETGFQIDGTLYEVPDMGTLTMDEAQVLYDYSGLTIEDFIGPEDETPEDEQARERRLRNPGFMRALMHIAYQRGNPTIRATRVRQLVGGANVIAALETLVGDGPEEADAAPLGSMSEPSGSSPSGSLENKPSSKPRPELPGNDSPTSTDEPGVILRPTGGSRSDTSSISPQEISAA